MTKSDPNIHQNAPNCTIYKNSVGSMPPNPLSKVHGFQTSKTEEIIIPLPAKSWLRP